MAVVASIWLTLCAFANKNPLSFCWAYEFSVLLRKSRCRLLISRFETRTSFPKAAVSFYWRKTEIRERMVSSRWACKFTDLLWRSRVRLVIWGLTTLNGIPSAGVRYLLLTELKKGRFFPKIGSNLNYYVTHLRSRGIIDASLRSVNGF